MNLSSTATARRVAFFVTMLALATTPNAHAQVTFSEVVLDIDGNVPMVPELTTDATWGGPPQVFNMEGMFVQIEFSGGGVEIEEWQATNPTPANGGRAMGADGDWILENLTQLDHSIRSPWRLDYNDTAGKGSIQRISIDGFSKFIATNDPNNGVVFDRTFGDLDGTTDSSAGRDFEYIGVGPRTHVEYRGEVVSAEHGGPAVGDIFRHITIEFREDVVPKWAQLPINERGENVHSDIDWRVAQQTIDQQAVADDFVSDGRPITAVRWWGSYVNPNINNEPIFNPETGLYEAQEEEGFLLSFFANDAAGGPVPGNLEGAYIAPVQNVSIQPTDMIGWDGHRIWQYEVNLADTCLDHEGPLALPDQFQEEAGVQYWLSVAAESGHAIDPSTCEEFDTGEEFDIEPFWGWHSTEDRVDDFTDDDPIVASPLFMPTPDIWDFLQWSEVELQHNGFNAAFELLTLNGDGFAGGELQFFQDTDNATVPEPTSVVLLVVGAFGAVTCIRSRRNA